MFATRVLLVPVLFLGLLINGWAAVAILIIVGLVDIGHKLKWTPTRFGAWLFACSTVYALTLELVLKVK